ncbi:MAG: putative oxidoreductase C-terminal domain-containing protein [Acidimicrobiales bacterium]
MHTLLFHEPGHFHAALLLAAPNPRIDPSVHVYATPSDDLDRFVALVDGFNTRADTPTAWKLQLHTGQEPLRQLLDDRRGEVAVVAGRNEPKLAAIARLHAAGLHVLADKPWLTTSTSLGHLHQATAGPPLVADIMTQRHDPIARLRRLVVGTEAVVGRLGTDATMEVDPGGEPAPAIEFASVHHLCKMVDGRPLVRPAWYYDVRIQGDGLVDIQSHMVDQAQWLIAAMHGGEPAAHKPIPLDRAVRWSTAVPVDAFAESTGSGVFPPALQQHVRDGVLHLGCNGQIDYRLSGVRIRQRAEWRIRPPAGGGDTHRSVVRGTSATVTVAHGPETGNRPQLTISPSSNVAAIGTAALASRLASSVEDWRSEFPGLVCEPSSEGWQLDLPPSANVSHEATFAKVLDDFLDRVDEETWSPSMAEVLRDRYRLLARGQAVATDLGLSAPTVAR